MTRQLRLPNLGKCVCELEKSIRKSELRANLLQKELYLASESPTDRRATSATSLVFDRLGLDYCLACSASGHEPVSLPSFHPLVHRLHLTSTELEMPVETRRASSRYQLNTMLMQNPLTSSAPPSRLDFIPSYSTSMSMVYRPSPISSRSRW